MPVLIEELIKSIEQWLRIGNKQSQPKVDPDLDPVLLVPGIARSVLNAVDEQGREERVWVRIFGADHEFRDKLWSRFDPATGKTVSMDEKTRIVVPEDRYGLSAIDTLDPDLTIGQEGVFYYHDLIIQMIRWGFQEGKTLFGFGFDFRQSNRLQETLDKFCTKLESVYTSSGGRKMNIITHSMGGLLVKCFMHLHSDIFEKYVKNWIAIAAPFQGAPGYITAALLNGCSFVDGWEQNFFISKWSMHQLGLTERCQMTRGRRRRSWISPLLMSSSSTRARRRSLTILISPFFPLNFIQDGNFKMVLDVDFLFGTEVLQLVLWNASRRPILLIAARKEMPLLETD